ncbi:DUF305 domain-containing protein [uncultured Psychrobacter sp.]|uniref:CopM family metallochaperone n=1 Tax=uncultured Psychrobacter sp. TaxID=259303 RepID=UPI0034585E3D
MTTIHLPRLTMLGAAISAALILSACQPTNDTIEATTEESTPIDTDITVIDDPHAGHDMTGSTMTENGVAMSDVYKEYNDSMTTMHDEMMVGMNYNDPDVAFAHGMLGHHVGAVDMAKIQLKYGTDAEMRQLAQEIIDAQQSEIEQMQGWLDNNPDAAEPSADTKAMQQAYSGGMDAMHGEMMLGIADPDPDMAFARGMLPHHVGAVDMAEAQLKYGKDAEMRELAQQVIDAQQAEIEQMRNWITAHGGTLPSA